MQRIPSGEDHQLCHMHNVHYCFVSVLVFIPLSKSQSWPRQCGFECIGAMCAAECTGERCAYHCQGTHEASAGASSLSRRAALNIAPVNKSFWLVFLLTSLLSSIQFLGWSKNLKQRTNQVWVGQNRLWPRVLALAEPSAMAGKLRGAARKPSEGVGSNELKKSCVVNLVENTVRIPHFVGPASQTRKLSKVVLIPSMRYYMHPLRRMVDQFYLPFSTTGTIVSKLTI